MLLRTYTYDAWGNCEETTKRSGGSYTYAKYNPFRYRGYYYDSELNFYYLNSRYYDPNMGRFINADVYVNANGNIGGYNMFAYCGNNPVMGYDPTGEWNWSNFWIGAATTVTVTVGIALAIPTGGGSIALSTALIITATATTGAFMTYAAATETAAVSDLSFSISNGTDSITFGASLVVDFKSGGIELYPHMGISKGYSGGLTYSTGLIQNYGGAGSYGGLFVQNGAGYYIGVNHCFDPNKDYNSATKATTITFGGGVSYGAGMDWYFDPIFIKKPN